MTAYQSLLVMLFIVVFMSLIKFQHHTTKIFGGALLTVYGLGWVDTPELLTNASNEGLATLILLMLISVALEKTSLLNQLTRLLFVKSERSSVLRTIAFSGFASALLNNTAVVAAMISSIQSNDKVSPSRILLPMCFAATLGGTMTLIGTSTNLVVNSMWVKQGHQAIGFFDLFPIGVVIFLVGSVVLLFTSLLLPKTTVKNKTVDQYFVEVNVESSSLLAGKTVEEAGLRHLSQLFLVEIIRSNRIIAPVSYHTLIEAGDKLLFSGDVTKIEILKQFDGLRSFARDSGLPMQILTEVAVKQSSTLIGKTLKSTGFRAKFDAAVVAMRRENGDVSGKLGDMTIKAGDLLLLATGKDFSTRRNLRKNFFVLSGVAPDNMITGWREKLVVIGFIVMILGTVVANKTLFSMAFCLFSILLLTGCINVDEIKQHFPVNIWLIVVSALCLANAMQFVGLDNQIAYYASNTLSGMSPTFTMMGVMILTIIVTELLTNNAAAALMFPIAYSMAVGMDINPYTMVLAVCFGASCAFISPFGYQTNLMVFNTGVYRLQDFAKVGALLTCVCIVICTVMIPRVYPF